MHHYFPQIFGLYYKTIIVVINYFFLRCVKLCIVNIMCWFAKIPIIKYWFYFYIFFFLNFCHIGIWITGCTKYVLYEVSPLFHPTSNLLTLSVFFVFSNAWLILLPQWPSWASNFFTFLFLYSLSLEEYLLFLNTMKAH